MKTGKNAKHKGTHAVVVRIALGPANAVQVYLAGSFNDWSSEATPMVPIGGGRWLVGLTLRPGTYEYRFVVDGAWVDDPLAAETVPNPFGGRNALLRVGAVADGRGRDSLP